MPFSSWLRIKYFELRAMPVRLVRFISLALLSLPSPPKETLGGEGLEGVVDVTTLRDNVTTMETKQ